MQEWINVLSWIVTPAIAGLVGAWALLNKKVADHDVRLGGHDMQLKTLEASVAQRAEAERRVEELMREILQRLARVEQKLEGIGQHLNGKDK